MPEITVSYNSKLDCPKTRLHDTFVGIYSDSFTAAIKMDWHCFCLLLPTGSQSRKYVAFQATKWSQKWQLKFLFCSVFQCELKRKSQVDNKRFSIARNMFCSRQHFDRCCDFHIIIITLSVVTRINIRRVRNHSSWS